MITLIFFELFILANLIQRDLRTKFYDQIQNNQTKLTFVTDMYEMCDFLHTSFMFSYLILILKPCIGIWFTHVT